MKFISSLLIFLSLASLAHAQSTNVKIWDGTDIAGVTGGALDVNATISTAGLATSAKQDTGNTSLASIDGKITACNTGAVVVSTGSLTCNAGTNLNTSALALESGGNLAAAATSLATLDNIVSGSEAQVDVVSSALPSGAATEATLSTLNGKVTACNTGAVTISAALPAGTNGIGKLTANSGVDIGDVDVTSIAAGNNNIGDVDVASIAAGTNLLGRISASDETTTIYQATTALTPKFAVIDAASSGDNTLVAAVSAKKIRVLNVVLIAAGAVTVRFESGAGGTALTGQMSLTTNSGFAPGYIPIGHFQTATNTLLNLELSDAVSVDGWLTYVEVD